MDISQKFRHLDKTNPTGQTEYSILVNGRTYNSGVRPSLKEARQAAEEDSSIARLFASAYKHRLTICVYPECPYQNAEMCGCDNASAA